MLFYSLLARNPRGRTLKARPTRARPILRWKRIISRYQIFTWRQIFNSLKRLMPFCSAEIDLVSGFLRRALAFSKRFNRGSVFWASISIKMRMTSHKNDTWNHRYLLLLFGLHVIHHWLLALRAAIPVLMKHDKNTFLEF